jgi:hypothetical protein
MNNKDKYLAMSRRGLNMYNPLQAKRSWGYRMTTTLSELRSSSIYKSEDKGERTNGRKDKSAKKTIINHYFRTLFLSFLVPCTLFLVSGAACVAQTGNPRMPDLKQIQGTWLFESARYDVYNHHDLSFPVDSSMIDNAEMLLSMPDFPFGIIFESMDVRGNNVICSFGKRRHNARYFMNNYTLTSVEKRTSVQTTNQQPNQQLNQQTNQQPTVHYSSNVPESIELPQYSCKEEDNRLVFKFHYSYGSSQYRFPVEGVLTVVYVKQ